MRFFRVILVVFISFFILTSPSISQENQKQEKEDILTKEKIELLMNEAIKYFIEGKKAKKEKDYKKAIEYWQKSLEIFLFFKSVGIEDKNLLDIISLLYNNIGFVYDSLGNYDKALEYYKKSLNIDLKTYGENHPSVATSYNNIGAVYKSLGNYDKAIEYFKKSLSIFLKTYGENHPDVASSYNNISHAFYKSKKYDKSFNYIIKGFDIFIKNKDEILSILEGKEKELYLKKNKPKADLLLKIGYLYYQQEQNQNIPIKVFNRWINYKGSILDNENIIKILYDTVPDTKLKEKIKTLNQKKRQLAKLYQSAPKDPKKIQKWENAIKQLEKEINKLNLEIASQSKKYKEQLQISKINYKDISNNLKEYELYIDYAKADDYYYIFTLDNKGNITYTRTKAENIDKLIKKFRRQITALSNNQNITEQDLNKINKDTQQLLSKIYKLALEQPIGNTIKNKKKLIISPDGALRLIPFEALFNPENQKYLIETKEITYIPSGKELVRLIKFRKDKKEETNKVVIFAYPDYNLSIKTAKKTTDSLETPHTNRSLVITSLRNIYFSELPWTKVEADVIAKELKKKGYTVKEYLKEKASEENLFKTKEAKILHLATHGYFIKDKKIKNPMLKALIALSGANKSIEEWKDYGLITALKLSGLNLEGTDIVVLSACETGVVDINSTEGISALAKAFILAGSKNAVISLWSVNDKATKDLMEVFYNAMVDSKSYSEALREAKLKMIKEGKHPLLWAPFILNGIW